MFIFRNKKFISIFGAIIFFFVCPCSHAEKNNMVLKNVVTQLPNNQGGRYVPLERRYEYLDYGGVTSPKMFIDDQSTQTVHSKDIESCTVQDVLFHPKNLLVYQVAFKLNDNLHKTMHDFFKEKIGKTIALTIEDDKVFTVVDVREPLSVEFTVTVFGRTKSEIKKELTRVCNTIIME